MKLGRCDEPLVEADLLRFNDWWRNEGSGMAPFPGEDAETHVLRVSKIAWLNGAYKSREAKDGA